tara:strand:- start:61493 stop:61945 length:453 start_codon:yes stop_codon:yes gene_type:complete
MNYYKNLLSIALLLSFGHYVINDYINEEREKAKYSETKLSFEDYYKTDAPASDDSRYVKCDITYTVNSKKYGESIIRFEAEQCYKLGEDRILARPCGWNGDWCEFNTKDERITKMKFEPSFLRCHHSKGLYKRKPTDTTIKDCDFISKEL